MLIDLHVHSTRYSACGKSAPEEMIAGAVEVGLDAVAITEHNIIWQQAEFDELRAAFPMIRLFRGVEVTDADGNDWLVYGVLEQQLLPRGLPTEALLRVVREHDGAVILAHPFRAGRSLPRLANGIGPDAVEVLSSNTIPYLGEAVEALPYKMGVPGISASDAHIRERIGIFATHFRGPIRDERELVTAIRAGGCALHADVARLAALGLAPEEQLAYLRGFLARHGPDDGGITTAAGACLRLGDDHGR